MRILGLDYGQNYVGVAISDPTNLISSPLETIKRKEENKLRQTYARIEEIVKEYEVDRIVVGLPKHMNNEDSISSANSKVFAQNVERRTNVEVILWDERLSTISAKKILMEIGIRRENRKDFVDKVAANIILQNYLDYLNLSKEEENNGKQ